MLPVGTQVDAYVLGHRVALGATGEVYSGRHAVEGDAVAVKVLRPEWCAHPEIAARFLNEAQALQESRHPHLVRALASGVLPGRQQPFLVLEWLPLDLHQWLHSVNGRPSVRDSVRIIGQLASVLSALHERGLIHRDLKPANVLVARQTPGMLEVKLADLGLAKRVVTATTPLARQVSTAASAVLGTWDYMAPEQWTRSKHVGCEVDVYALGILWFQLLAGRLPFQGEEQALMYLHVVEPPPLSLLEGRAPPGVREWIGRMLNKAPAKRPLLQELQAFLVASAGALERVG